jgi:hypothetical protein
MRKQLDSCPAKEFRQLPVHELFDLVISLPEEEVHRIIDLHEKCVKERNLRDTEIQKITGSANTNPSTPDSSICRNH